MQFAKLIDEKGRQIGSPTGVAGSVSWDIKSGEARAWGADAAVGVGAGAAARTRAMPMPACCCTKTQDQPPAKLRSPGWRKP